MAEELLEYIEPHADGTELTAEEIAHNERVYAQRIERQRQQQIDRERRRQERMEREREQQREEERRYYEDLQRRDAETRVTEMERLATPDPRREGMVISALPNSLWRVERRIPEIQTGRVVASNSVERNLPPIIVSTHTLASEFALEATREGRRANSGVPRLRFASRPSAKLISVAFEQDKSVTLTVELARVNRNIWIMPSIGVMGERSSDEWKRQWAPWIRETHQQTSSGVTVEKFLIPIELPRRRWTASMPLDKWGRGFMEPELYFPVAQTRRGRVNNLMGRWIGGNHGSDLVVCWGQSTRQQDPLTTFESFDSLFFDSTFNQDLQHNRSWSDAPRHWGLEPGVERIPRNKIITVHPNAIESDDENGD